MFNALGQCAEYIGGNPNTGREIGGLVGKILRDNPGNGGNGGNGAGAVVGNAPGGGGALASGSSVNAMTVNQSGREVQVDMRNWLRPMTRVGSVTGVNAFPRNTIVRDPYQYGFRGFSAYDVDPDTGELIYTPDPVPGIRQTAIQPMRQGSILDDILRTVQVTLPATISAIKGKPYYNPSQNIPAVGYGAPGYAGGAPGANIGATAGAAVGNVGDAISQIVQQHPLLVLAAGVGALLLFMSPPRSQRLRRDRGYAR